MANNQSEYHVSGSHRCDRILLTANEYIVNKNRATMEVVAKNMEGKPALEVTDYPTVDISPWIHQDEHTDDERSAVLDEILKHATDAGSFNITGHGVPSGLIADLERTSKNFFNLPLEEKQKYTKGNNKAGYVGVLSESNAAIYDGASAAKDLREVYGSIYPPETPMNVPAPTDYQATIEEYLEQMNRVDKLMHVLFTRILARVKGVSLPDDFLESAKGDMIGLMRCSYYPDVDAKYNKSTKLAAHSDFGTLAFLYSSASGLEEIRDCRWIKVPIRPGELHVNVAEMLHIWSNGLFVNNIHRVSGEATDQGRVSMGYFSTTITTKTDEGSSGIGGVDPVCAAEEAPKFGKISAASHVENYLKIMF